MIEEVRKKVCGLSDGDDSGHGVEHIDRVLSLALKFTEAEKANKDVVALIALLHDVDDYKRFGRESAENLTNAKRILRECSIEKDVREQVLSAIKTIGYGKRLKGIKPSALEAMVVSDADMCDAIGVSGILRSYQYSLSHNNLFFDKNVWPKLDMSASDYMANKDETAITHAFEKQLRLKDLMLTDSGKNEAKERHDIVVRFLYHFFEEENVPEWTAYLTNYLKGDGAKYY